MISTAILFYAALAASLLLSLVGLLAALREPGLRFRLLWAVLALVGVGGGAIRAKLTNDSNCASCNATFLPTSLALV